MFKIVLMNSVWWWAQQKLKDFLLYFFIFVWVHSLDCNIVKMCWCLKCYIYKNCWQFCWILNERHSRRNISFTFLDNYDVIVDTLLLSCHLQDVMRKKHHLKTQSCYDFDLLRCWRWNECKLCMRKSFLYIATEQRDHQFNWFENKEKLISFMFCVLFIIKQSWIIIYLNVTNLKYCAIISLAKIGNKWNI